MPEFDETEYAWEITRYLVEDCYPRLTGTPGAEKAANYIGEKLEEFCDRVEKEEFTHRPKGFLKFMPIAEIFYLAGLGLLFTKYFVYNVVFTGITVLMFVSQLLFYWGWFDFLFPKEKGLNVYGVIEPEKEVKQQVILSGHYDAPYVFQLLEKLRGLYPIVFGLALFSLLVGFVGGIVIVFAHFYGFYGNWVNVFKWVLIFLSLFTLSFFFFTTSQVSPGAGDNAVAVGIVLSVGRKLSEKRPIHTRVIILTPDGEEAGLNGARAFIKKNKKWLKEIPTYNFNVDVVYEKEELTIFARDLNYLVGLSKKEAILAQQISEELGLKLPITGMPLGGGSTDSAEFGKAKIDSIALVGLNFNNLTNSAYHSSRDTMDALSKEGVRFSIQLLEKYVLRKDEEVAG